MRRRIDSVERSLARHKRVSVPRKDVSKLAHRLTRLDAKLEGLNHEHGKSPGIPPGKVLVCDNYHIHKRNFASLFAVLENERTAITVGVDKTSAAAALINCRGDYSRNSETLAPYLDRLRGLDANAIDALRHRNVDVLKVALPEILSEALKRDHWQDAPVAKQRNAILARLWESDRDVVLSCCAAAMFWIDYWSTFPDLNRFDAAVVFSGSYIYAYVLMRLLTFTKARCFVVESFMTGTDYFLEERHDPLPNNSSIRFAPVFRKFRAELDGDQDLAERALIRSVGKLAKPQNKNVAQPASGPLPAALRGRRVVLVIGQVVNDFSIIAGSGQILNTIPAYQELIFRLLQDPDIAVVFKAHPWEMKKLDLRRPLTEEKLRAFAANLPESQRDRLWIVSDCNLSQLLTVSSDVVTLCSQAALEAALEGLKPVIVGGAFYSGHGFTTECTGVEEAVSALTSEAHSGTLTLDEYRRFESFITVLLDRFLVEDGPAGHSKVLQRLTSYKPQGLAKRPQLELSLAPTWETAHG